MAKNLKIKKDTESALLYCDSAAAMPLLPQVREFLVQRLSCDQYAAWGMNLSSDHAVSKGFQKEFEAHTSALFQSLKCTPVEWFWTSGATESNEWALQIAIESTPLARILAVHPLSHPSLSAAAQRLAIRHGLEYKVLPLLREKGFILDPSSLPSLADRTTWILALPLGDHELGTIDPLIPYLQGFGWLHFDAAQSFAKIKGDFQSWPCTSLACSGTKIGALPGLGGLYVRLRPKKTINPLFVGGSQQNALRAGTLPFLSIITFCIAYQAWTERSYGEQILKLRLDLEQNLRALLPAICVWSSPEGLPHICLLELPASQKDAIGALKSHFAFSQGSACQKGQGSEALRLAGFDVNRQRLLMRIGLSPYNLAQFERIIACLEEGLRS